MNQKTKKVIYWVGTGLVAFALAGSAMVKLSGGEQAAEMAKGVGGVNHVILLGVLELFIVALWLFPRTGVLGALLAIAYMGGAMAVHFVYNQPILTPLAIQVLIWLVSVYRFPELTKRLFYGEK